MLRDLGVIRRIRVDEPERVDGGFAHLRRLFILDETEQARHRGRGLLLVLAQRQRRLPPHFVMRNGQRPDEGANGGASIDADAAQHLGRQGTMVEVGITCEDLDQSWHRRLGRRPHLPDGRDKQRARSLVLKAILQECQGRGGFVDAPEGERRRHAFGTLVLAHERFEHLDGIPGFQTAQGSNNLLAQGRRLGCT